MKKHKAQKEREEGDFQYSGSDDEAAPEADERAGEPSSILQVNCRDRSQGTNILTQRVTTSLADLDPRGSETFCRS